MRSVTRSLSEKEGATSALVEEIVMTIGGALCFLGAPLTNQSTPLFTIFSAGWTLIFSPI